MAVCYSTTVLGRLSDLCGDARIQRQQVDEEQGGDFLAKGIKERAFRLNGRLYVDLESFASGVRERLSLSPPPYRRVARPLGRDLAVALSLRAGLSRGESGDVRALRGAAAGLESKAAAASPTGAPTNGSTLRSLMAISW